MAGKSRCWARCSGCCRSAGSCSTSSSCTSSRTTPACSTCCRRASPAITNDRRLQLLLVAFCFGAFFEGAAGFGTPVAVTAAILMGLGFKPLAAAGLSLIANTAPVAFGALGTPIIVLAAVTGLDLQALSAHGRPAASVLLGAGAVLADLGVRRFPPHDRDLAGDPGRRRVVRGAAVPGVELPRTVARRRRGGDLLDGCADAVPQVLASEAVWTVDEPRRRRPSATRRRRRSACGTASRARRSSRRGRRG